MDQASTRYNRNTKQWGDKQRSITVLFVRFQHVAWAMLVFYRSSLDGLSPRRPHH